MTVCEDLLDYFPISLTNKNERYTKVFIIEFSSIKQESREIFEKDSTHFHTWL
jgi:hypothetical protein